MNYIEIDEQKILDIFPFETPRDIQMEAIISILQAYNEGYEHVVLDAPTAAGKSGIAFTVAKYITSYTTGNEKALLTTITKFLQDQYLRDFPELNSIKSAQDPIYTCDDGHLRQTEGCALTMRETSKKCMGACPYKIAQKAFFRGPLSMTNTHFISRLPYRFHTLIFDECHELGNVVTGAAESPIFEEDITKFSLIFGSDKAERLTKIWRDARKFLQNHSHGEVFIMPEFEGFNEFNFIDAEKKVDALAGSSGFRSLKGHLNGLMKSMNSCHLTEGREVLFFKEANSKPEKEDPAPVIKPIFASDYADQLLFSKGDFMLHMSATVCGAQAYAEEMGFENKKWTEIEVNHPIAAERRKFFFKPLAWMSAKSEENDTKLTATFIDKAIDHYKANTILHTASYKRAEKIKELCENDIHVPRSAKEAVEYLTANSGKAYVASPSIVAGVDGKDDLCRLNVICKVPYPSFGDPRIKYIAQKRPDLISQHVIRNIVQAAGRGTRHEKDYSHTFMLDGIFEKLYSQNPSMFPAWFTDAIVWRTPDDFPKTK